MTDGRMRVVCAMGVAQTLAWASSYYLAAILAAPMAKDFDVAVPTVFAAFSLALIVSASIGPYAGRAIDRLGGRPVLIVTSLIFAAGLSILGLAQNSVVLFIGWIVLGIGMGSGLYEAAFAALVRLYGHEARGAITGVTLFAGFASTVGWPLSTWLEVHHGWRDACFAWAALHLLVGLPLNVSLPRSPRIATSPRDEPTPAATRDDSDSTRASVLLAYVFAVTWFVSTAMAAHLPRLMMMGGATLATALLVGTLIGPAQVGARVLEFTILRKVHPLLSARLATLMHPVGAILLLTIGPPVALLFGVLHGAGNGILTIAKGTLPLVLFGPAGYGHRQGLLMVPARIAQALAPWLFGLCIDRWGISSLWLSTMLGLTAFAALLLLRPTARTHAPVIAPDAPA